MGPFAACEELAWSFRELVDRHDGRPVFYEISEASLPVCVNRGLAIAKLGEDARVPLKYFSLQGSHRAELRQALNRARREGASFDIVPRQQVTAITAELTAISNDWLKDNRHGESFCNFEGLRHYKEKFYPEWKARQSVAPFQPRALPPPRGRRTLTRDALSVIDCPSAPSWCCSPIWTSDRVAGGRASVPLPGADVPRYAAG